MCAGQHATKVWRVVREDGSLTRAAGDSQDVLSADRRGSRRISKNCFGKIESEILVYSSYDVINVNIVN